MAKTVLLIATHDTKEQEALFLKGAIESNGVQTMVMDTGILAPPRGRPDISQDEVADRGGMSLSDAVATGDKRECTEVMCRGRPRLPGGCMIKDRSRVSSASAAPREQRSPARPCESFPPEFRA
mgnify:CR=1 FL=1